MSTLHSKPDTSKPGGHFFEKVSKSCWKLLSWSPRVLKFQAVEGIDGVGTV